MPRDIHREPFDEETIEKLRIYESYLREFLPVFLSSPMNISKIQIFDFFAGPGQDAAKNPGSPLITRQVIDEVLNSKEYRNRPPIRIILNELDKKKVDVLNACMEGYEEKHVNVICEQSCEDFPVAFETQYPSMKNCANLIFLDQYGIRQITQPIFQKITELPRTDFIFFISSSIVNRFRNLQEIKSCVPIMDDDYSKMNGSNVHRVVADAYRRWVPPGKKYFLGSFSIKKGSNVYGLVFGTGHPLGIDKFLKVVWRNGGDANFNIDNDLGYGDSLFAGVIPLKKLEVFAEKLKEQILSKQLRTQRQIYIFSLENGMLGRHAKEALNKMVKDGILPKQEFAISYDAWKDRNEKSIILKGGLLK